MSLLSGIANLLMIIISLIRLITVISTLPKNFRGKSEVIGNIDGSDTFH